MNASKSEAKSATDSPTKPEKKEVMQSNLPLLFANGSPISLESMNLVSRYVFVIFRGEYGVQINFISNYKQIFLYHLYKPVNFSHQKHEN